MRAFPGTRTTMASSPWPFLASECFLFRHLVTFYSFLPSGFWASYSGIYPFFGSLEWSWRSASGQQLNLRHREFVTVSHSAHWIVWETQNDGNVMALGEILIAQGCDFAATAIFGLGEHGRESFGGTCWVQEHNILGQ